MVTNYMVQLLKFTPKPVFQALLLIKLPVFQVF